MPGISTTYYDEAYCHHCDKDTPHEIHDSGHERDSSGDWRICQVCKWYYSGYTGEYHEPLKEENKDYDTQ